MTTETNHLAKCRTCLGKELGCCDRCTLARYLVDHEALDLIFKQEAREKQATSTGGSNPQLRQTFAQADNSPDDRKVDALIGKEARVSSVEKGIKISCVKNRHI